MRCPISYYESDSAKYSEYGLSLLCRGLKNLNDFPYTAKEQIEQAVLHSGKMSIQGVQPKLSAVFNKKVGTFEIVDFEDTISSS